MSEGELEKRLKFLPYGNERFLSTEWEYNIKPVLEEMKKEFPIQVIHPPHCSLKREKNINYWRNKILRMEKWFEKWFGE